MANAGTKPLYKPMLIFHKCNSVAFTLKGNFTGSALATILKDEFENYSLLTYHQGADQLKKYPYESESESNLLML